MVVPPKLVVNVVAEYRCKDHHGNQDGVGDGEYQYKDKTDDAELSGLLQFFVVLAEDLWDEETMCLCVCGGGRGFNLVHYTHRISGGCYAWHSMPFRQCGSLQ